MSGPRCPVCEIGSIRTGTCNRCGEMFDQRCPAGCTQHDTGDVFRVPTAQGTIGGGTLITWDTCTICRGVGQIGYGTDPGVSG